MKGTSCDGGFAAGGPHHQVRRWKQSPHGSVQAHLATHGAQREQRQGKSCQPWPSCLLRSLGVRAAVAMLPSPSRLLQGSSFRPSRRRCPVSESHSSGVFIREHNGEGKAADHTRSQQTAKFTTKKRSEHKHNVQNHFHLFAAEKTSVKP